MLVCGVGLLMHHQEVSVHVKYAQLLKIGMYRVHKNVHPHCGFEQSEVELNPIKIQQYTESSFYAWITFLKNVVQIKHEIPIYNIVFQGVRGLTSSPCAIHDYVYH
jgi:hypothetical protein